MPLDTERRNFLRECVPGGLMEYIFWKVQRIQARPRASVWPWYSQSSACCHTTFSSIESKATAIMIPPGSLLQSAEKSGPKHRLQWRSAPSLKWPSELISLCQMPAVFQQHKQKCKRLGHSLSFIEFSTATDLSQLLALPQLAIPFPCLSWNL